MIINFNPGIPGIYGDRFVVKKEDLQNRPHIYNFMRAISRWGGSDKQTDIDESFEVNENISESVACILVNHFGAEMFNLVTKITLSKTSIREE